MDSLLDIQGSQHPVCPHHLPDFHRWTFPDCRLPYTGEPGACILQFLPHRF